MSTTRATSMTMNLSPIALLVALGCCINGISATTPFQPYRIDFDSLVRDQSASTNHELLEALTTTGLISITGMPGSFVEHESKMLRALHDCTQEADAAHETVFKDGTRRRTLATHSLPGPDGVQTISYEPQGGPNGSACQAFDETATPFREAVHQATNTFAQRLSSLLQGEVEEPLLVTQEGVSFPTVEQVVEQGEHLEHFHSYQGVKTPQGADDTVEWHTDQGLFLVFTPARWADGSMVEDGFSVELPDGTQVQVQFDTADELVILLGDGVNQFVNPKMKASTKHLRAAPHALAVPKQDQARVWYGRMVLAPADAIHPLQHGDMTVGEIRSFLVMGSSHSGDAEQGDEGIMPSSLGCSSTLKARDLETTCEEGELYCWMRCMSLAEYNVSEEICQEQGLDLYCTNPRRQLWTGLHGDYFPGCVDVATAENYTDWPPLPARDEAVCNHDAFAIHRQASSADYDHEVLMEDGAASFQWSVKDGKLHGKLLYNGLFGWISFGLRNTAPDAPRNGMNGAKIILGLPGDNYSETEGLDTTMEENVREYTIHPTESAFRHWSTPVTGFQQDAEYDVEDTECYTSLIFSMAGIQDQSFNFSGTDELIWAANAEDTAVDYHSARGIMFANWAKGEIVVAGAEAADDESPSENGSGSLGSNSAMPWSGAVLALSLFWHLMG